MRSQMQSVNENWRWSNGPAVTQSSFSPGCISIPPCRKLDSGIESLQLDATQKSSHQLALSRQCTLSQHLRCLPSQWKWERFALTSIPKFTSISMPALAINGISRSCRTGFSLRPLPGSRLPSTPLGWCSHLIRSRFPRSFVPPIGS